MLAPGASTGRMPRPPDSEPRRPAPQRRRPATAAAQRAPADRRHRAGDHAPPSTTGCRRSAPAAPTTSVVVKPYTAGTPDRIAGRVRRAGRSRQRHRAGSIPTPRRSPSTAPRSRSTTRRPSSTACTSLQQLQHGHDRAGDGRRARASRMPGWSCATPNWRSSAAPIVAPIAGIVGILPIEAGNYVTTSRRSPRSTTAPGSSSTSGCPSASPARSRSARRLPATPIAQPEGRLSRQGERRRQPHRRERAARCGCGPSSPIPPTCCAPACRSRSR